MRLSFLLLIITGVCLCGARRAVGAERTHANSDTPSATSEDERRAAREFATTRLGAVTHVSKRVLQTLLDRDVAVTETVTEQILDMATTGTARVDCKIGLDLVPNSRVANLRLSMIGGVTVDDAVSSSGSVRIYSSSQTQLRVDKNMLLDAKGVHLLPARASARSTIQIHNIDSPGRFVEAVAWRRAGRSQSEVEEACGQRAARRAEIQLESEVGKSLGKIQQQYVDKIRQPLTNRGAFPDVRLATTRDHLSVRLLRDPTLTKITPLPNPLPPLADDVAVCLSDLFVNEMAAMMLGGKTLTDRDLADLLKSLTGVTPRPLWIHARAERWSVTAAAEQPLVVSFAGDRVSIALHIDHAARGADRLDRGVAIGAVYALQATADGPHLTRDGRLVVEFADSNGGKDADPREEAFREFLRQKFSGVFLSDLYFDGLAPPDGPQWGKLRRLELKELSSRDGWLNLGYELHSVSPIVSAPRASSAR